MFKQKVTDWVAAKRLFMFSVLPFISVQLTPLAMGAGADPSTMKGAGYVTPEIIEVEPGVWRLRFGVPDAFTPNAIRAAEPKSEALKKLPSVSSLPFPLEAIRGRITDKRVVLEIPCRSPDSDLYGFGIDPDSFRQKGQTKRPRVSTQSEGDSRNLRGPGASHAPSPLYFSTEGYGVYVDTAATTEFHLARLSAADAITSIPQEETPSGLTLEELYTQKRTDSANTVVIDVAGAKGVDLYLFAGPGILDAVQRYNLFSGGGAIPPLWGMGVKYRTFVDADEEMVRNVATGLREREIACDMLGLEPKWQTHAYPCSFRWSDERFPDSNQFISDMKNMGFKLNLWIHFFIHPEAPFFDKIIPYAGNYLSMRGLVPDMAHPDAVKILQEHMATELIAKGISGFKIDECDRTPHSRAGGFEFPNATYFPSGVDGQFMGEMFGLLLQRTVWSLFREADIRTWSDVRSSGPLASPLPFLLYSDTEDLGEYLRKVCNASFSGHLWSPETRNAGNPTHFQRRLALSAFAHQFCLNPWFNRRPLWENYRVGYGNWGPQALPAEEQEHASRALRYFTQLRMSLIPYLYSAYRTYGETGRPPIRALVLDFPEDKAARSIDNQFMFGDSIMVAPYLFANTTFRRVYLPAGADWRDYWTGELYQGGQTISARVVAEDGVERPALYVRNQSIVPVAKPVQFVAENTVFEIECRVYGDKPEPFTLFEDDGVSYAFEKGAENRIVVSLANGAKPGIQTSVSGAYNGKRYDIATGFEHFDSPDYVSKNAEPCSPDALGRLTPINLAQNASYTLSSTNNEAGMGNLFGTDEGPDTHAFSTQKQQNAHIVIDLKQEEVIGGVSIANRRDNRSFVTDRAETLAMWTSIDGETWELVWQAEEVQPVWSFLFKQPVRARYLKLGLEGDDFLHLRRLKLFAPK